MHAIQPCALLLLVGPDWSIEVISANAAMLGDHKPGALIGQPLADLIGGQSLHSLRNRIAWLSNGESDVHDFGVQWGEVLLDIRASGQDGQYLIEAELVVEPRLPDPIGMVRSMSDRLAGSDPADLAEQAMRQLCTLTGFDRMALCDRSGKLVAESARGQVQYLETGCQVASDIALIADRDAEPVPLLGELPAKLASRVAYRAPDDSKCDQLADDAIAAELVLPLRIDGELVGTLQAQHGSPRRCGAERRGVAHLFSERLVARMARRGWKP